MNTLWELLFGFLQIGLFSIGGGYATIPLIQEQVVDLHHWLTIQEFTDIITISQMTPGPLAVNTSSFVGIRVAGLPGAVVATFGCVASGFFISIVLYKLFARYEKAENALLVLNGLKAASTGLIAASASTILMIALFGISSWHEVSSGCNFSALCVFLLALFGLRKYKINPILIILLAGVAGILLYGTS